MPRREWRRARGPVAGAPASRARRSRGRTAALLAAQLVGFAALLFVTRFLFRPHLVPLMDQECHIGAIAVDVLAHGVRFPIQTYAPNEYDNGSFFSGLLAAASFWLFGRNLLALKLVTHLAAAAGAVAAWWLLRGCLDELGFTDRRARRVASAALVIAIALAPRVVTLFSTYAVGNHAEGSAIDTILLALFAHRWQARSPLRTAAYWALAGLALYLNKGTVLVLPALAAAEIWRARRAPLLLLPAIAGVALGLLPELRTMALQHRIGWGMMGWATIAAKEQRNAHAFPGAFFDSLLFVGEHRIALLAAWALAIAVGSAALVRAARRAAEVPPVTLALVVGVAWLHLGMLSVMAKPGLDAYVIYGYPTIVILYALLVAAITARATARWGRAPGAWVGAAAIAATLLLYRPDAVSWGAPQVAALWHNRAGAACTWRFAEGFLREADLGLAPPGESREQHAIARCRALSDAGQVAECIGGIARELEWRQPGGRVHGSPPADLTTSERTAYAYWYGTHRKGNTEACRDFDSADLTATCDAAVALECLHFADLYTKLTTGQGLAAPRCPLPEPPVDGFWAARRRDLLGRTGGRAPDLTRARADDDLGACKPILDACY